MFSSNLRGESFAVQTLFCTSDFMYILYCLYLHVCAVVFVFFFAARRYAEGGTRRRPLSVRHIRVLYGIG